MWKYLIIILIAGGIYAWSNDKAIGIESNLTSYIPIKYSTDLSINDAPIQKAVNNAKKSFPFDQYRITPLASFQSVARVLGTKHYTSDREAALSPVDLALGWGPMAKKNVLDALSISQSGRWYRWRTDNFPIPRRAIETNSANMHFIPGNTIIEKKLKSIREGDTVKFLGYLVHIEGKDGWQWTSSLTRNDKGNHSCEVVLLEDIATI